MRSKTPAGHKKDGKYIPAASRAEIRGKSPSGEACRPPCSEWVKSGKCSKGDGCREWHVPACAFFKRGMCLAGDKCNYMHRGKSTAAPKTDPRPKAKGQAKKKGGVAGAAVEASPLND